MASVTQKLHKRGLIHPPPWLPMNVHYETVMGSVAYGCADTSVKKNRVADTDVYGFAIPPKDYIFPHLRGEIAGFGTHGETFHNWQKHHILDEDANAGKGEEFDISLFNIVSFFELCRGNNPNMIDSLFVPENCILHCTNVGQIVRDNRRLFLSKLCWKKFRGYAMTQLKKMNDKNPVGKRREIIDQHGYDVKFAYHIIRLFDEVEQIMLEGDLDLQRAKETMKAIRRGDWTVDEVRSWAMEKEKALEVAYTKCKLPERPPEKPLYDLLIRCLEEHYGSLEACVTQTDWAVDGLKEVDQLLEKFRTKMYSN